MDNNFYNERRERHNVKEEKGFMTKVIVTQLVLSLLITGFLFLVCRTDSNLSQNIKSFYSRICKTDIAVSEIFDSFKNVVQETFSWGVSESTGETESTTGEKADFSPVFLTVNFESPIKKGNITSKFGYRISPITNKYSLHTGLDVAAPQNTKIYAVYDGVVIKAQYHEINGNYIVIKHSDNLKTTYNHCNKLLVNEGEKIKKGEVIALVGETGYATGNHLHFEVLLNGKYINPLYVLNYDF
ncbi:MAG: M23 family metallopeptidase [Clostridia bacterium]|nr:M23 family metallopeptidase [Clostridia bacterium]